MCRNRNECHVRGENNQNDMEKFLTVNEDRSKNQADFFRFLTRYQADDSNNVSLSFMNVSGLQYGLLVTEHPFKRASTRSALSKSQVCKTCLRLLSNGGIGARVIEHPVYLGGNGKAEFDENIGFTAIVDEETNLIYIFQAGFAWIRLVTIVNINSDRPVFAYNDTQVLKLRADGFLVCNEADIPEVIVRENKIRAR